MKDEPVIDLRVEGVSKRYRIGRRRAAADFWALRDVSFDVGRGEALGVIGRNGAGKSTLLKLLAGITAPTTGRIVIHGRLAALIEVGSGFHPELTGRENVYLSGSILGMRRREIDAKLDRIITFAGVEPFIDTPVKWYSSGMYVRLGFSVAAHLEPDVLLVDEVLAVGDAEFQGKCLERIAELRQSGVTLVFISHDLTTVERLCDRALLLERGAIAAAGDPAQVVAEYHRRLTAPEREPETRQPTSPRAGTIELIGLTLCDGSGRPASLFRTGEPLVARLRYRASRPVDDVRVELSYYSPDGRFLYAQGSTPADYPAVDVPEGDGAVEFTCPELGLRPGAYYVGAVVRERAGSRVLHWWDGGTMLHVEEGTASAAHFHMPHTWRLLGAQGAQGAQGAHGAQGAQGAVAGRVR